MLKVVLVGRPNVGKSTLFNRLVRSQKAIVNDQPGVTRDRKYGQGKLADLEFILIDTAGIDDTLKGSTEMKIKKQSQLAIDDANVIFFVIDGRDGVLPIEKTFAMNLKKQNKPIVILINKSEGSKGIIGLSESASLGFDNVIPISAEHGEGLPDLYDVLKNNLDNHNINKNQNETCRNLQAKVIKTAAFCHNRALHDLFPDSYRLLFSTGSFNSITSPFSNEPDVQRVQRDRSEG